MSHLRTLIFDPFRTAWRLVILAFGDEPLAIPDVRANRNRVVVCLARGALLPDELAAAWDLVSYLDPSGGALDALVAAMERDGEVRVDADSRLIGLRF